MHNKRVQASGRVGEARHSISALFGCAEFLLEEWIVLCADYGKVEGHFWRRIFAM